MVGGGSRRDEGSLVINNTNVFAALETLRKKKKTDKDRKSKGSSKSAQSAQPKAAPEPAVQWAPAPLNATRWADVEDEDDYLATTAPPKNFWGPPEPPQSNDKPNVEESESEEDILDEGDDDVEEEHDHDPEVQVKPEPVVKKPAEVPAPPKEAERQLSKKEKKKKELAELEALLADFGVAPKESDSQDELRGVAEEKDGVPNGDVEKKENQPTESKSAKKKKKKEKASKEAKESQAEVTNGPSEVTGAEQTEEDVSNVDVKERLKKMASVKKKKSGKEFDAAAKAAAQEAAARAAKLAAAKKKEKNHYNQQPVR